MKNTSSSVATRKQLADSFPKNGSVRAKQAAAFLGIGISTLWRYVSDKDGRIKNRLDLILVSPVGMLCISVELLKKASRKLEQKNVSACPFSV